MDDCASPTRLLYLLYTGIQVRSDGTNAVSYQYDVYGNVTNQSGSRYDERQFAGEQADSTGPH